jgi:mannose-6-phosphate isomerase-like protein (cupin superfamily)
MGTVTRSTAPTAQDWAVAHNRRVHAACVARRLQPVAAALGGYASGRLRVRLPGEQERRPAVALAVEDPPVDGIAGVPPLLVIELAPSDPAWWLAAGTREVWVLEPGRLVVHRAGGEPVALGPDDHVAVPAGGGLRLVVSELLPRRGLLPWPRR